jgi:hypothetical protein
LIRSREVPVEALEIPPEAIQAVGWASWQPEPAGLSWMMTGLRHAFITLTAEPARLMQ